MNYKLEKLMYLLETLCKITLLLRNEFVNSKKSICTYKLFFIFLSIRIRTSRNMGDNGNLFLNVESKLRLYHVVLTKPRNSPKKVTLTLIERQLFPNFEKTRSKVHFLCLKWTIYNGRIVCIHYHTDTDKLNFVVYRYRKNIYLKNSDMEVKMTENERLISK